VICDRVENEHLQNAYRRGGAAAPPTSAVPIFFDFDAPNGDESDKQESSHSGIRLVIEAAVFVAIVVGISVVAFTS
jgi:hypothetical protein